MCKSQYFWITGAARKMILKIRLAKNLGDAPMKLLPQFFSFALASGLLNVAFGNTTRNSPEVHPSAPTTPCTLPRGVDLGRQGSSKNKVTKTRSGAVLMGGGEDVDAAFKWMIDRSGGGDFVVLRSEGTDAYNSYIDEMGGVNSVQTLLISNSTDGNNECVAETIRNAGALFLAGGDQQNYIDYFKEKAVGDAINYLINTKHAPVGGTSAGMAIMGQYYHPGGAPENGTVLDNPGKIAVGEGFLKNPLLAGIVTEPHFSERGRQPRLVSFMASAMQNLGASWQTIRGIAADESAAFAVDGDGTGKVFGSGNVFFAEASGSPETLKSSRPLTWSLNGKALRIYEVSGTPSGSNTFNIKSWNGIGGSATYWSVVDGVLKL